jgi:hypothetical protein
MKNILKNILSALSDKNIKFSDLKNGKTKAYQVRQVRNIIIKYELHKEEKNV